MIGGDNTQASAREAVRAIDRDENSAGLKASAPTTTFFMIGSSLSEADDCWPDWRRLGQKRSREGGADTEKPGRAVSRGYVANPRQASVLAEV
ncbi:hypothetical protein [Methylocapsa palsarum]|uniref:Uncharacterized protein n=1 Tax=Methylocapsa palsarum TaxID=1612308 RepID=A0A1I3Y556_9HYPH|nr:hypothetical protein [Methylocapsa palsarum]SFK26955.1 hypothetical protein SAMN05444581_10512 [Methylocapsa palsarum]